MTYRLAVALMLALASGAFPASPDPLIALAPNDHCGSAQDVTGGGEFTGNTIAAVNDYRSRAGEGFLAPEVVYRFTLSGRRHVVIDTSEADFFTVVYVRSVCEDAATEVASSSTMGRQFHETMHVNLDAGTYHVFVDGDSGSNYSRGRYVLRLAEQAVPEGDTCGRMLALTDEQTGTTTTFAPDYRSRGARGEGRDVVFRLTLDRPRRLALTTEGSAFDTVLYVRRACAKPSSELASNDDASDLTTTSSLTLDLPAGSFAVFLDGWFARAAGTYRLTRTWLD